MTQTLHMYNQASIEGPAWGRMISATQSQDALVLLEDGCSLLDSDKLAKLLNQLPIEITCYALERNLPPNTDINTIHPIQVISDDEWVQLCVEYKVIHHWLN